MTRYMRRSRIKSETSRKRDSRIFKRPNRSMPSTNNTRPKRGNAKYLEKKIQHAPIYPSMSICTVVTSLMMTNRAKSMRKNLHEWTQK
jgi:hypothetical protein